MTPDSGGAGTYRGGLGYHKTLRATTTDITASQCTDRHHVKTWALFGGKEGANGATLVQQKGRDDWRPVTEAFNKASSSKYSNIVLHPGDRVRLSVSGGGGYGKPLERDRAMIEEDLREGYITPEGARRDYGVEPR